MKMLSTQATHVLPHHTGPISRERTGHVRLESSNPGIGVRANGALCVNHVAVYAAMADQWNTLTRKFGPSYHSQRWRFAT